MQQQAIATQEDILETKHGEVTGRELFRVLGLDMAWMPSEQSAKDVAARLRKAAATGYFVKQGL